MKLEVLCKWQGNPSLISSIVFKSLGEEISITAEPVILNIEVKSEPPPAGPSTSVATHLGPDELTTSQVPKQPNPDT